MGINSGRRGGAAGLMVLRSLPAAMARPRTQTPRTRWCGRTEEAQPAWWSGRAGGRFRTLAQSVVVVVDTLWSVFAHYSREF